MTAMSGISRLESPQSTAQKYPFRQNSPFSIFSITRVLHVSHLRGAHPHSEDVQCPGGVRL